MLLLSITIFYTGLHQVIWNGVHTTCVGLTVDFGDNRKSIAALGGVFFGIGEVIGGIIFGFIGGITARKGREPIIIIGFVTSGVAYFLMFLNLPPASPIRETLPGETGYLDTPSTGLVLFTGFLLGFSDSCFVTQVQHLTWEGIVKLNSLNLGLCHTCWIFRR